MKNNLYFLIAIIILLNSCAASNISFDILAPAPVYIPSDIKTLAIIDRSFPENEDLNRIEGILTGEGQEQDQLNTQFVIDGLNNSLRNINRFSVVRTKVIMQGSGSGFLFPIPLSPATIDSLCRIYEVDAIVSLETYDSDFIVSSASTGTSLLDLKAGGDATVKCGFRMYSPSSNRIIDEFHYSHSMRWDAGNIFGAANVLLNKNKAIQEASNAAGIIYGQRITPNWYLVNRDYFKKSKDNFDLDEGARMMQLNEWDKAIIALEKAVDNGGRKDRGRAAHNLAVVYEILSDLELAKEWTTVAWGRYKEKKSRDYGYILNRRINDSQVLQNQLEKN